MNTVVLIALDQVIFKGAIFFNFLNFKLSIQIFKNT